MRRALTFDRVHLIRAAGKSDGHWASFWLMTVAAGADLIARMPAPDQSDNGEEKP
jgi:hypothetical protein